MFLQRHFFLRHRRSVTSTSSYANYNACYCLKKSMFQSTRTALFASVSAGTGINYEEDKRMKNHRAGGSKVKRMFSPPAGRVFGLQHNVAASGQLRGRQRKDGEDMDRSCKWLMRKGGLEPPRREPLDPKSITPAEETPGTPRKSLR